MLGGVAVLLGEELKYWKVSDSAMNFVAEIWGVAVTVAIVDVLLKRALERERKQTTESGMASILAIEVLNISQVVRLSKEVWIHRDPPTTNQAKILREAWGKRVMELRECVPYVAGFGATDVLVLLKEMGSLAAALSDAPEDSWKQQDEKLAKDLIQMGNLLNKLSRKRQGESFPWFIAAGDAFIAIMELERTIEERGVQKFLSEIPNTPERDDPHGGNT